jgi:acyl-coenzyme A synthetase/AMP-(fatty) acid ligase
MREKRWLAHYDEGVPHTLAPYPLRTLLTYVAETVRQRPDRPGMSSTADDIRAHCREHLAPYKVPASVAFCHELPKTLLVGKVMRHKLGAVQTTTPEGSTAVVRQRPSA